MRGKRNPLLALLSAIIALAVVGIAPPAAAASPSATLRVVADWGTGWQDEVVITNTGTSTVASWTVELDLPDGAAIGTYWEADLAVAGSHQTFTNRTWNGTIPAGSRVVFGFIGSGEQPVNCTVNGLPCDGGELAIPPVPATTASAAPESPADPTVVAEPASAVEVPPASELLPITVTNETGRGDPVFLYVLGTNLETGELGYVDANGAFTAWSGGESIPVPAPDVSIPGPGSGATTTIRVPRHLSGRLYFSFGSRLDLRLTTDGLVQPAPWVATDPNHDIFFDWSEFTIDSSGLWLNSSQVDMFAVPHIVSVTGGSGTVSATGGLVSGGRQKVIDEVRSDVDFARSVVTAADGSVLRVLAPGKAVDAGLMSPTYLDSYIAEAWNAYTTRTLTVAPFTDQPELTYSGRSNGEVMTFTDASGRTVASFDRPSTADVWGCDGALAAPNDLVVGPIARSLCAALQRTTLGRIDTQPSGTSADFYRGQPTNVYARAIHANMADGKAYAFPFDDVSDLGSLVHDGDPRIAGITLTPF